MLTTDFCEQHGCQCADGCPQGCYLAANVLFQGACTTCRQPLPATPAPVPPERCRQCDPHLKSWTGDLTVEEYTVAMTEEMVAAVQRGGIAAIEHYYLNTRGGALRQAGLALGLDGSPDALADFIGGRT